VRIRSLLLVGAFVSMGGSGAVAIDQGKGIEQTAMDAHMPTSLAEQVRSADLIRQGLGCDHLNEPAGGRSEENNSSCQHDITRREERSSQKA
jgi:hypothetical protein